VPEDILADYIVERISSEGQRSDVGTDNVWVHITGPLQRWPGEIDPYNRAHRDQKFVPSAASQIQDGAWGFVDAPPQEAAPSLAEV